MYNNIKLSLFIFFSLILLFPFNITAQETDKSSGDLPQERTVTLTVFIETSLHAYPSFTKILNQSLYLKYLEDQELDSRDFTISDQLAFNYQFDNDDTGFKNNLNLSKLFPQTGTTAEGSWQFTPKDPDPTSSVSLAIYQDIAKNAFGKEYALQGIRVASRKKITEYQIIEAYEDLMAVLLTEYYNWVTAAANLATAKNNYQESLKIHDNIRRKYSNLIAGNLELNQIKLTMLNKQEAVIQAQYNYDKITRQIKDYMKYKGPEIKPGLSNINFDLGSDFDSIYNKVIKNFRTYQILSELEKEGFTSAEIKKRSLLPSAQLFASYNHGGTGFLPTSDFERSLSVGVSISKLLPGKKDKAAAEIAEIDYRQILLDSEITKDSLKLQLYELFQQIKKNTQLLDLYQQKLEAAQQVMSQQEQDYNIGKSSLNDLIDSINSLDSARYSIDALQSINNTYMIEWLRLTDNLVRENMKELTLEE